MLFAKGNQTVVAVQKVGKDHITVIVAICIENTEDRIGFVMCQDGINQIIRPKQQNGGKSDTHLSRFAVTEQKIGTTQKFLVRHGAPRMILHTHFCHLTSALNQVMTKIGYRKDGIYLIHKISILLSCIELIDQISDIGNINVRVMVSVKYTPVASTDLRTGRNVNVYEGSAVVLNHLWLHIKRWIYFLWIVN